MHTTHFFIHTNTDTKVIKLYSWLWVHQLSIGGKACNDGQLGHQQDWKGKEESQRGKTEATDRQHMSSPEKHVVLNVRPETAEVQHLVEKILMAKIFSVKDSYELKFHAHIWGTVIITETVTVMW